MVGLDSLSICQTSVPWTRISLCQPLGTGKYNPPEKSYCVKDYEKQNELRKTSLFTLSPFYAWITPLVSVVVQLT